MSTNSEPLMREAFSIIQSQPELADFGPGCDDFVISAAEEILGVNFSSSYRLFLVVLGVGDFNGHEIYGLINSNLTGEGIPNVVWVNANLRKTVNWPVFELVVYSTGTGSWIAIDLDKTGVDFGKMKLLSPFGDQSKIIANDFSSFFHELIVNDTLRTD